MYILLFQNLYLCVVQALTKAQISYIKSFAEKKTRDIEHAYVAEGLKSIIDILKHGHQPKLIFCTQDYKLPQQQIIPTYQMEKISQLHTPTTVLAIFYKSKQAIIPPKTKLILVLDGLQDPGNLGTIIRTAHWYGVQQIVCSTTTVDAFGSKCVQATMGSIAAVNIIRTNVVNFLQEHTHISKYATVLSGTNVQDVVVPKQAIIVIGKEGEGISADVQACCNCGITIPQIGSAESLNAAVATGIILNKFCS
jgi:RNA methyltransferase, TrmH family